MLAGECTMIVDKEEIVRAMNIYFKTNDVVGIGGKLGEVTDFRPTKEKGVVRYRLEIKGGEEK